MPELDATGRKILRRHELQTYKRCPWAWKAMYVDGFRKPEVENPDDNLTLGTWHHKIIATGLQAVINQWKGQVSPSSRQYFLDAATAERNKLQEVWGELPSWLGHPTVLSQWWTEVAATHLRKIIAVEMELGVTLEYRGRPLLFQGRIDGLAEDRDGNLVPLEHKTTGGAVTVDGILKVYEMNEQLSGYHALLLANGYDAYAWLVNETRKFDPDRAKAPVVAAALVARNPSYAQAYVAELEACLLEMAEIEDGTRRAPRVIQPLSWMGCFCPGGFESVTAGYLRGQDPHAILQRLQESRRGEA